MEPYEGTGLVTIKSCPCIKKITESSRYPIIKFYLSLSIFSDKFAKFWFCLLKFYNLYITLFLPGTNNMSHAILKKYVIY